MITCDNEPDIATLLKGYAARAVVLESAAPTTQLSEDGTILLRERQMIAHVNRFYPAWDGDFKRVAVAALLTYRKRFVDTGVHEHVELLRVLVGNSHLRAHDGAAHLHRDGAWAKYSGAPSEGLLEQTKTMLLELEGLFSTIAEEDPAPRSEDELLHAMHRIRNRLALAMHPPPVDDPENPVYALALRDARSRSSARHGRVLCGRS